MEQLHFITKLLDIKDPNIQIIDIINRDSHKEIIAKLDYEAPLCPDCGSQMKKYDFQKPSKIPYLETTGMPTRILLKKRRFKCYQCSKMMVAETSLVKKNHQIPRIINQKIAQKLIEKAFMSDISHQLLSQLQLSFACSMTPVLSMIFLDWLRLCLGTSMFLQKEKWALLLRTLTSSISSPFLKEKHELSFEITFLNMIERSDVEWKSLPWICFVPIMTWLNSFAFEFLGSVWNRLPDCFTPMR